MKLKRSELHFVLRRRIQDVALFLYFSERWWICGNDRLALLMKTES